MHYLLKKVLCNLPSPLIFASIPLLLSLRSAGKFEIAGIHFHGDLLLFKCVLALDKCHQPVLRSAEHDDHRLRTRHPSPHPQVRHLHVMLRRPRLRRRDVAQDVHNLFNAAHRGWRLPLQGGSSIGVHAVRLRGDGFHPVDDLREVVDEVLKDLLQPLAVGSELGLQGGLQICGPGQDVGELVVEEELGWKLVLEALDVLLKGLHDSCGLKIQGLLEIDP